MSVDDPRAGAPDGCRDVVRIEPAAQERDRRARTTEDGAVTLQQLGVLAQPLTDEPEEVVDSALLAAGGAISVVQEQDQS